jgi:AbrB family looped-hinge helix DNA binding protein
LSRERDASAKKNPIENPIESAIVQPMTATITLDSVGRFVLPKAIREKMHLQAGSKLRVDLVGEKLEISVDIPVAKVVLQKDGLPTILGWEGFDATKAVREMHGSRTRELVSRVKPSKR